MSPTPITLLESSLSSSIFRNGWDAGQDNLDPKVVGSHLPLGKRNSTPVGVGSLAGNPYNHLKVALAQQQQNQISTTQVGGNLGENLNTHRSLDRCHSEPLKAATTVQVQPVAPITSSRYKTELCRPYAETGFCKYGEKCQFAHGSRELRNMPRHPKYKTELCRTFHTTGLCGYGTRCHFIHNADERRNPSPLAFGGVRGGDDDLPLQNLTPPSSIHGSPTSAAGTFFGDTFSMVQSQSSGMMGGATLDDNNPYPLLSLDTPPVSPVESLAGDIEGLSLSPALSDSPSPPAHPNALNALMDSARYFRLPIFESLKEGL